MKILQGKFKLLPLLVLVGIASFLVRSGEFAMTLSAAIAQDDKKPVIVEDPAQAGIPAAQRNALTIDQLAQRTEDIQSLSPAAGDKAGDKDDKGDHGDDDAADHGDDSAEHDDDNDADTADIGAPPSHSDQITGKWRDAVDRKLDTSQFEESFIEDLAERKERLAKKERELAQREALLKAAEQEIDRKYTEMTKLRDDIQDLLGQQSDQEFARIESLVKIYSGMKAGDAARIFNTLDQDILVEIMTRMSERKTGPILAEMDPEKARLVTILMAEQRRLPDLPDDFR